MTTTTADKGEGRNWTEDFSHENGRYQCRCCSCGSTFLGHKRRVTCKLCASNASTATTADKGELLPCPFCGEDAAFLFHTETEDDGGWRRDHVHAECGSCEASFPSIAYGKRDWRVRELTSREKEEKEEAELKAIAAWNRRPTNEGQEGLAEDVQAVVSGLQSFLDRVIHHSEIGVIHPELYESDCDTLRSAITHLRHLDRARHLSQQSPDRVEVGDLNSVFESGECQDAGHRRGWFGIAEFIWHRALNQRLAVKEGEACKHEAVFHRKSHLTGKQWLVCAKCDHHREVGEAVAHTANDATHPVSDDQQAKDAARYRWLCDPKVKIKEGDPYIVFIGEGIDAAIDAALSITKQKGSAES